MRIIEASRDQFGRRGIHLRDTSSLDPSCGYNSGRLTEEILIAAKVKLFPMPKITPT